MLTRRTIANIGAMVFCTVAAFGQPHIQEWSGIDGSKYTIDQTFRTVTILESDVGVFSFEGFDLTTGQPTDIDLIETAPAGVTGTVRVQVAPDPASARTKGARAVKRINLTTATTSELTFLDISDSLGVSGGVNVDSVSGPVTIGADLFIALLADTITADITISGHLDGVISAGSLGNLNVNHAFPPDFSSGSVIVTGSPYAGTLTINGELSGTGNLVFLKNVTGSITIGTLSGVVDLRSNLNRGTITVGTMGNQASIDIDGNLRAPGFVKVTQVNGGGNPNFSNAIHVHGSLKGSGTAPLIEVTSLAPFDRTILVDGSLRNANSAGSEIVVDGNWLSNAAIAIDYDGWDPLDSWVAGATIIAHVPNGGPFMGSARS